MVFTDFVVPGLPYIAGLALGTLLVMVFLYAVQPPVTERLILAVVPWIIAGACLHVFYQLHVVAVGGLFPEPVAPIFSAPAVYFTTFIVFGIIWAMAAMIVASRDHDKEIANYVGLMGIGVMLPLVGLLIWQGMGDVFELNPILPTLALIISLALTFVVFILIGIWRTYVIAETRYVGALVLFAHIFDAVTTAIGVELMGAHERSSLPRIIMDFTADLPTASVLGEAWLFVLLKILLAVAIVVIFADYVREKPAEGNLFFGIIAAVGLGPGVNNFFLFILGV